MLGLAGNLFAGGSGLNTLVVVNQNSANSLELGNYYCERRQVPPENVLRVNWTGGNLSWSAAEFQAVLLDPLLAQLAARQLTNQIDFVVLSMDLPFQTANGSVINSTTAALFYGLKTDSGPEWAGITNSYAASERVFRQAKPASAPGHSFLTTMITAGSLAQAKQLVDQGVNADGTFPSAAVVLAKSSDPLRNLRHRFFDNAIFNARLSPVPNHALTRVNANLPTTSPALLGLQTGLANFSIAANSFVPGAMADSMTSYGGVIFGPNGQTSLLAFIHAGAAGSYGTVTEPLANTDKFPHPQNYFYQARGFTLAECYYQSLLVPYQGLIVGEPLSAPFRRQAPGQWSGIASNTVLSGTAQFSTTFTAANARHPLQQIDLFLNGKFLRTVTNLPPQAGNVLNLNINGRPIGQLVPQNATIGSLASSLATLINQPANSNATRVMALARGDRIELRATSGGRPFAPPDFRVSSNPPPGTPTFSTTSNTPPVARAVIGSANVLSTFLTASGDLPRDTEAAGVITFSVNGTVQVGTWLRLTITKTNGGVVNVGITNQVAGAGAFALTEQLVNLINATPGLQGADGVVADDLVAWLSSGAQFALRARSAGVVAANVQARLTTSNLVISPSAETTLTENVADLQPRNHIYVTTGATALTGTIVLNTTTLPDGYHELTAVAYEGSHVQTQSRTTLPIRVQNTGLSATLTRLDLPDSAPVNGTYQIQVTANTNNVSRIQLFSTGGLLGGVNNQASATFVLNGATLGVGQHSLYAVVETTAGLRYRTQPQTFRLVAGP